MFFHKQRPELAKTGTVARVFGSSFGQV
jgi:hypothetical protein